MGRNDRTRRGAAGRIQRARERRLSSDIEAELVEARRRDHWRVALISALAHDVRSPLAAVVSMAELLRVHAEQLGPQRRDEIVHAIVRQARRTLLLADDLLDLARLEEGEFVLKREQVGLEDVVRRAIMGTELDVSVDIPGGLVLSCDPGRVGQIVANLVDNARRHGKPPVEVEAQRRDGVVRLAVRDAGDGVPDEVVDRLFTRFGGGDHPDSVGLGLWISAQLAQAHGGSLDYRHAVDGGAEFVLTLPDDPQRRGDEPDA